MVADNASEASGVPKQSADQAAQASLDQLFGADEGGQGGKGSEYDLQITGGDLTFGEDLTSEGISLEGLQDELEHFQGQEVVANILGQGSELRELARDVEDKLRQVELESIQDYIRESDNLVSLHTQIRDCDGILAHMEALLSGFQADLGAISSEIKSLQEQSLSMGVKLKNRKSAEAKLARFVEDVVVPPDLIQGIVDAEVSDAYLAYLTTLNRKLHFAATDPTARTAAALKDVEPELERLRIRAVAKSREFLLNKFLALKKPKTNIQILQQSVLLKYKYMGAFLREHGREVYPEIVATYSDTMNKVLSAQFRTYIGQLEKLQLDIVSKNDLIGVDDSRIANIFSRKTDALKNRSAVFALGDRANVLKEVDAPAIIPHIAEASHAKYPYEALFRSLHKLLMDTATSEYLFCMEFFGEEAVFDAIFAGVFAVIDESFEKVLPVCYDAVGLLLMIRITNQHQLVMSRRRVPCLDSYLDKVNLLVWPRFKAVFDLHLASVKNANVRALWEDDVHAHYVARRYAEFASAMAQLTTEGGDQQLEHNLERLRTALDDLLGKLARNFPRPKQQAIFLINNYDVVLAVLKEHGSEGGRTLASFEELLASAITIFVEEELREHFGPLIAFVKTRAVSADPDAPAAAGGAGTPGGSSSSGGASAAPISVAELEPLFKDFAARWKTAIESMHKDVITYFSNFVMGMEILRNALTQLLLYYTRLLDCLKRPGGGGTSLGKDVVSIPSIMYEIKKYSRTF
ncbi:vacuolar protein sorting-associated protein [Klebsormidium nitens]|uniref:Vacuolar protein sorting-associated protein n=1 Tax=Klebsormidium nitens TaxID=105231 RepID=A0A1Y1IT79_KLENI|nr:vacuolar protein sorting-associated protein [Klebsormidium nitens]|eukprot:GAQ91388.1 vacuolar protein sorting-associated protein [Klebsormidium nitens]